MPYYIAKIQHQTGKVSEEKIYANNPQELNALYESMQCRVLSFEAEGGNPIEEELKKRLPQGQVPQGQPATVPQGPQRPPMAAEPPKPKYTYYETAGIKFRVDITTGKLEKHDWVEVKDAELYSAVRTLAGVPDLRPDFNHDNELGQTTSSGVLTLFKLQWVPIAQQEEDDNE